MSEEALAYLVVVTDKRTNTTIIDGWMSYPGVTTIVDTFSVITRDRWEAFMDEAKTNASGRALILADVFGSSVYDIDVSWKEVS